MAYGSDFGDTAEVMTWERITVHPIVALPHEHSLAAAESVSPGDLADQPLISFASGRDGWAAELFTELAPARMRTASSTLTVPMTFVA